MSPSRKPDVLLTGSTWDPLWTYAVIVVLATAGAVLPMVVVVGGVVAAVVMATVVHGVANAAVVAGTVVGTGNTTPASEVIVQGAVLPNVPPQACVSGM